MRYEIDVITTDRDNPDVIHEKRRINWANSGRREWLAKHINYAVRSGMAVHIAAAE